MNEIMLPIPQRKELQRIFKVGRTMVWLALKGRSDSDLALRIRKAAIEKGGKEFNGIKEKKQ